MNAKLYYLLFPLGVLAGYWVPHPTSSQSSAPPDETGAIRNVGRSSKKPFAETTENARIHSLVEKARKQPADKNQTDSDIPAVDIPAVIAQLMGQCGINGPTWKDRSAIINTLTRWAKNDFESAFAWACSDPNPNASKDFLKTILAEHAKDDYEGTIAKIRMLSESGVHLNMGAELFDTAAKRSAKEAFELLTMFPSTNNGMSSTAAEFPPNFDFKTFAELTANYLKDNEKTSGGRFSYMPYNLLESWADVDASAALEFYITHDARVGALGEITQKFFNPTQPESAYPWIAEQYATLEGEQRAKFAKSLTTVFPLGSGVPTYTGLVESIANPDLKKQMTLDLIHGLGSISINNQPAYLDLLLLLPTPEERLDTIRKNDGLMYVLHEASEEKLAQYGITKQQIESILPKEFTEQPTTNIIQTTTWGN